jgi:hypothetical protein
MILPLIVGHEAHRCLDPLDNKLRFPRPEAGDEWQEMLIIWIMDSAIYIHSNNIGDIHQGPFKCGQQFLLRDLNRKL